MKTIFILLVLNISSMLSIAGTVYMAMNGVTGWGWFICAAILLSSTPSQYKEEKGGIDND